MVTPELVEACRRRERGAFEELVDRTYRQAFTLAVRLVGDRHDAEDVTQEAYLRVFRSIGRFRGEARFETWLYRIVTNAAMTHLSRRGRFGDVMAKPEEAQELEATAPGPEQVAETDEVARALARLPAGLRTVLVLKDVYDLPVRDIAAEMGLNEGAVKVRLHRARRKLKEIVYGAEEAAAHEV